MAVKAGKNGMLRLPPWVVPDTIPEGATYADGVWTNNAVSALSAKDWSQTTLQAANQAKYPLVWTPDSFAPWGTAATTNTLNPSVILYQPPHLKATSGYLVRRPRILSLSYQWAGFFLAGSPYDYLTGQIKTLCDQGNILAVYGPSNETTNNDLLMGGLPVHSESLYQLPVWHGSGSTPLYAVVGNADPAKMTGGDFFYAYYARAFGFFGVLTQGYHFDTFYAALSTMIANAAAAFNSYGRLNIAYTPIIDDPGNPDARPDYNTFMTALGDTYGQSQNAADDATAFGLLATAVKTFFNL